MDTEFKLSVLALELTQKCNLNCLHCGLDVSCSKVSDTTREELTKEEYFSIIDQAKALGCKQIIISGGEPFIREDIWQILDKIHANNIGFTILSNGLLINQQVIEKLGTYKKDLSYIRLSIDYPTDEEMKAFRGVDGIVTKLKQVVSNLSEHGIRTGISMTIIPENLNKIISIAHMAREWGAAFFRAVPVIPTGMAKDMTVDSAFYRNALIEMLEAAKQLQPYYLGTNFMPDNLSELENFFAVECPAAKATLALSAFGDATFCAICGYDLSKLNIQTTDLKTIMGELIKEKNKWKDVVMNGKDTNCSQCNYVNKCFGGCVAERVSREVLPHSSQEICMKEIWHDTMEQIEQSADLRRTVNNILNLYSVNQQLGVPLCYRSLPIWWFPLLKNSCS